MRFSLIQIYNEDNGIVDGVWLQDCTGSLETAINKAKETEKANGNKIKVAIVEKINGFTPNYNLLTGLKRIG